MVNPTKGQCAPAADTSAGGPFFSAANAWSGCVWQSAPNSASMILDAALWTSPLTRNPDFDPSVGDVLVSAPPDRQGVEPALAIAPSMGSAAGPGLTSLYAMWTNLVARPPAELVARAGVLDANAPPYRDLDRPAIAAVRTGVTRLDAHFTWGADLLALTYHLNKIIVKSDVPEPFSKRSDVSNGRGVAKCDVAAPDCIVGNAVSDSDKLVFYQAYSACGLLGADEGPF